jgi:FlaA1/EpsC-like NDP-sugar epimerase
MNEIDPAHRFSVGAVRAFEGDSAHIGHPGGLNATARQIAIQYREDTMSPVMVSGALRLIEFALMTLVALAVHIVYFGSLSFAPRDLGVVLAGSLLAVILLEFADAYQMATLRQPLAHASRLVIVWAGTFALLALVAFLFKVSQEFSRVWFAGWFAAGLVSLFALRIVVARLMRRWARNGTMERRAVIVGGGPTAEGLIRALEQQPYNDIRICGIFDDRDERRSPPLVAG